ncbi:Chaperone ClpB-like protein, partial [Daphnia magna]
RKVRNPPRRGHHRPSHCGGGRAQPPLHHRPFPARQGHRPDRRGGGQDQDRDRLKPEVMDKLDRRMIQLKIEREAVRREKDEGSIKRLGLLTRRSGWARVRRPGRDLDRREGAGPGQCPRQGRDRPHQAADRGAQA